MLELALEYIFTDSKITEFDDDNSYSAVFRFIPGTEESYPNHPKFDDPNFVNEILFLFLILDDLDDHCKNAKEKEKIRKVWDFFDNLQTHFNQYIPDFYVRLIEIGKNENKRRKGQESYQINSWEVLLPELITNFWKQSVNILEYLFLILKTHSRLFHQSKCIGCHA